MTDPYLRYVSSDRERERDLDRGARDYPDYVPSTREYKEGTREYKEGNLVRGSPLPAVHDVPATYLPRENSQSIGHARDNDLTSTLDLPASYISHSSGLHHEKHQTLGHDISPYRPRESPQSLGHDFPGYHPRESSYPDDRMGYSIRRQGDAGGPMTEAARNGMSPYGASGKALGDMGPVSGVSGIGLIGHSGSVDAYDARGDPASRLQENVRVEKSFRPFETARVDVSSRLPEHLQGDASANTLFVEGLPIDCTRREVAHLFRPFVGFRQLRVIHKEPRKAGGEPYVLCFVEFANPECALTALDALQGYNFDESDKLCVLKLQLAHFPGTRPRRVFPPQEHGSHVLDRH